MRRPLLALLVLLGALASGCGTENIELAASDPDYKAAQIFEQRCAGCHTMKAVGSEGSSTNVDDREYKDGPNFDQRKEDYEDVLYAIRNGGFSSGPMPQNIVVGEEAEAVARFVAKYSGE